MILTKEQALERAQKLCIAMGYDPEASFADGDTGQIAAALLEAQAEALDWAWTLDCGVIFDEEAARLRAIAAELRGER